MVDIHAHVLPGVDDGPDEWGKALKMLRRAAQDGITAICATPHVVPGGYDNTREKVVRLTAELRKRTQAGELDIYPGSEILVCPDTLVGLEQGMYCTLNLTRYVLVELPPDFTPSYVYDYISAVTGMELVPVVAHPERNGRILKDGLDTLYEMAGLGALMQVTAAGITGLFGSGVRNTVQEMLNRRLVHVMASDAHSVGRRPPVMSKGVEEAARIIGRRAAGAISRDIPRAILDDGVFDVQEPLYPKKGFALL